MSPPSRWSGLKSLWPRQTLAIPKSPPSRWSGLKYDASKLSGHGRGVSTLAVEWIEIASLLNRSVIRAVSTLAVEWIEIILWLRREDVDVVSTLAVEWIEIQT